MERFGIDISTWQRNMDLSQAKREGVEFAIIRGMYGNGKDVHFESLYSKAKAQGFGVGAYQWGRACNIAQAREEAQLFVDNCLKGKQFEYPIYYDVEDNILIRLSVQELTDLISAWCEVIERNGYYAGIYMNQSCFNSEVNGAELASKYTQWRACWTTKENKPIAQMWQFGGETNLVRTNIVAGQVCDQDYAYEDFPAIMIQAGLNGFSKVTNNDVIETPKKSIDELAREVIDGKWFNREDRKTALTNAGYDYDKVQAKVNEILNNKNSYTYYKIQYGDTLSGIAQRYATTTAQLMSWNNIVNANLIFAGKTIRVK